MKEKEKESEINIFFSLYLSISTPAIHASKFLSHKVHHVIVIATMGCKISDKKYDVVSRIDDNKNLYSYFFCSR